MKKLIFVLILLLISSIANGQQKVAGVTILGGRTPVGGSDEFGYLTEGGTSFHPSVQRVYASALSTPTHTGTTTAISLYSSNSTATEDIKVGLYTDNAGTPNTLVGSCQLDNVGTWSLEWHDFPCVMAVTEGAYYWITIASSSASIYVYYNSLTGTKRHYDDVDVWNNWNDPYDSNSTSASQFSFKVKYNY